MPSGVLDNIEKGLSTVACIERFMIMCGNVIKFGDCQRDEDKNNLRQKIF